MIGTLLLSASCLCLVWFIFGKKNSKDDPPVLPKKLPLVGHGYLFIGNKARAFKESRTVMNKCSNMGGVIQFYLGPRMLYGISDPEDCKLVSNVCLQKDNFYDFTKSAFGDSLFTGNGEIWKRHRKLLNPAFSQPVLNSFIDIFNSQSKRLIHNFEDKVGQIIDHEAFLRSNNLETICMTVTGGLTDEYNSLLKEYLPHFSETVSIFTKRVTSFWLHNDFIYNLTPFKRKEEKAVIKLNNLSSTMVQKKKIELKNKTQDELDQFKGKSGNGKPFLDYMLELTDKTNCFTDDEIREEMNSMIAAGHDSTASVLTMTLILLGSYPQVQNKVYEEIIKVFGDADKDIDKDDLSNLVYIEAVLKETMRLYPVAPFVARNIDKEVKLKNYTLKPNNGCVFFIWELHRHKMWGADADQFRPERWMEPNTWPDLNYYGAFGLGRRGCIGKTYGMMSMKIYLVHLIRKFKVTSDITKLVLKIDILLRPEEGHHIVLELR